MQNNLENKNIGKNVRLYRIKSGLTIKDLSKRIYRQHGMEIKAASIRNYEKGVEKIAAAALVGIASITNIDIKEFYEKANPAVLLDSQKIHLLEAFCMIRYNSARESLLHLARKLAKTEKNEHDYANNP